VIRGGSWNVGPQKCRSARRDRFDLNASLYDIGFRVVCRF
jgi:formylglycine-generating enzyme required for sulfatase activity